MGGDFENGSHGFVLCPRRLLGQHFHNSTTEAPGKADGKKYKVRTDSQNNAQHYFRAGNIEEELCSGNSQKMDFCSANPVCARAAGVAAAGLAGERWAGGCSHRGSHRTGTEVPSAQPRCAQILPSEHLLQQQGTGGTREGPEGTVRPQPAFGCCCSCSISRALAELKGGNVLFN